MSLCEFLSTPSGWRATVNRPDWFHDSGISIHALRVEGDMPDAFNLLKSTISIHALRVEGDLKVLDCMSLV